MCGVGRRATRHTPRPSAVPLAEAVICYLQQLVEDREMVSRVVQDERTGAAKQLLAHQAGSRAGRRWRLLCRIDELRHRVQQSLGTEGAIWGEVAHHIDVVDDHPQSAHPLHHGGSMAQQHHDEGQGALESRRQWAHTRMKEEMRRNRSRMNIENVGSLPDSEQHNLEDRLAFEYTVDVRPKMNQPIEHSRTSLALISVCGSVKQRSHSLTGLIVTVTDSNKLHMRINGVLVHQV
mmetsp:Transcript_11718/g.34144  ORF Transcript_11718/g.34144 Transcript_11718/m.34144 type:complete len:235 (-) Transcript_11718:237-941(-)